MLKVKVAQLNLASMTRIIEVRYGNPHEELTQEELNIYRKYIRMLNWLANNMRPDIAVYVMNSARSKKKATLKDLRDINRILLKFHKKETRVMFKKVTKKVTQKVPNFEQTGDQKGTQIT